MGRLLVPGDQVQLKLEGGGRVRQQKRLPDWDLEGLSRMPCGFLRRWKGLSMGAKGRVSLKQKMACDRKRVPRGAFSFVCNCPRFISHEGQ